MFFDVSSSAESNFSQNFVNTVISPLDKTLLSFLCYISIQSDSASFEFMDRSVRGIKYIYLCISMLNMPDSLT